MIGGPARIMYSIMSTPVRYLSKSKIVTFLESPRKLWDQVYNPDALPKVDPFDESLMAGGIIADELFAKLQKDSVDCRKSTDLSKDQVSITREWLAANEEGEPKTLLQPSFEIDELYCRVDVLRPTSTGSYALVECKAVNKPDKDHVMDAAIQTYIARKAGAEISEVKIAHFNPEYRRQGDLDLSALFTETDVTAAVNDLQGDMPLIIDNARAVLALSEPPVVDIMDSSMMKMEKGELRHYAPGVMTPDSVLNLPGIFRTKAIPMAREIREKKLAEGSDDLSVRVTDLPENMAMSPKHAVFRETLRDKTMFCDREEVRKVVEAVKFPVTFLDFETVMHAIPQFDGAGPNTHVPFQVCSARIEAPGEPVMFYDHLAHHEDADPRIGVIECLAMATKGAATTIAYNASFELGCLRHAADLATRLGHSQEMESIASRMVDIGKPFMDYKVFSHEQGGKGGGLKHVSAALFKDDPYAGKDVTGGAQASFLFTQMATGQLSEDAIAQARAGLEQYCRQDVYGMVDLIASMEVLAGIPKEERRFGSYLKAEMKELTPIVGEIQGEVLEPKSKPKPKTFREADLVR